MDIPKSPEAAVLRVALPATAARVSVVGDFDDWKNPGVPLHWNPRNQKWEAKIPVEAGVHSFRVLQDGKPMLDPLHESALKWVVVPPDYLRQPAALDDDLITLGGLDHRPLRDVVKINNRTYEFRFRTRHDDVRSVSLAVYQGDQTTHYPMTIIHSDEVFDWFRVKAVVHPETTFSYRFVLNDGDRTRVYSVDGLSRGSAGGTAFRRL